MVAAEEELSPDCGAVTDDAVAIPVEVESSRGERSRPSWLLLSGWRLPVAVLAGTARFGTVVVGDGSPLLDLAGVVDVTSSGIRVNKNHES